MESLGTIKIHKLDQFMIYTLDQYMNQVSSRTLANIIVDQYFVDYG